MSKDAKNVPALRFKGYSDAWEKRKLQELLVERNDPSIESKTYPLMSFTGTDGVTPKGRRYDRSALVKSSSKKYKKTQKNDLIYSSNNLETGSIGLNKTGNAVISPVYSVFQVTDEAIPSFMGNMILRRRFIDKMLRYRQGIMYGQWRIHELDFLQIVVNVPQTAEQFQIGQLFSALDALIAATQDKIDALEQAKRALLQRLFDQSWRFKGYSGSWEKHKLGDLAKRVRGNDGRMDLPILTISAGNGWLTQKERFSQSIAGNELKNYTLLAKNELSYNHGNSKLAKYGAVFALKKYNEALVPRVYHSFDVSGKADSNFIEYLFSSKTPDHELRKLISSGARMDGLLNINYASFMNISLLFPSIEEQQKISRILEIIRKLSSETLFVLSRLAQIKKDLLQELFI